MSLRELEPLLAPLSHGDQALAHIRDALRPLSPEQRLAELAENMVTPPLIHNVAQSRSQVPLEPFNVLQGDIIKTEAAYQLGERLVGDQSFIIATSSCDLIPGRRPGALLLRVQPRRRIDFVGKEDRINSELNQLTMFKPVKYFYLPALADDDDEVLFNVARVDQLATCSNENVNIAERRASLSLIGWRLLGCLVRELVVREGEGEAEARSETGHKLRALKGGAA